MRKLLAYGLIVLALGLAAVVLWRRQAERAPTTGIEIPRGERSVLLITVDTTRPDHLEPYGAADVATPVLARLAGDGIVFDSAYAVAPITLVAHTSILTGLYPPQHGVRNNGTHYVPEEITTLAERLAERGYRTGAFVSAAVLERRYGLPQGFEHYDDDLSAGRERHPRMVPDRPAEATVDSVTAWLDGLDDDERYFAWVHFYDPHASYSPPPPYRDRYRGRLYAGEIAYMDAQIGRLFQHPRVARERDLAIAVLGDHGESLGEHGEQTHAILAYDSTLRVPWILKVSGGPASLRVREPVSQVDLVPTLLDLLDLRRDSELPGRSLIELLERGPRGPAKLYSETYLPHYTYGWAKLKVLRRGSWKYIAAPTPELYDLGRDPRELSNVHAQQPGVAHDLGRDLEEMLGATGDPERETSLVLDYEAAEKLRGLGYLAMGSTPRGERERADPKDLIDLHVGLERARRLMRDRLFPAAIGQLREVLARDPNNVAALIDLTSALEQNGEVDEALLVIEKALSLEPDTPRLHLQLASLEARRGEREKALQVLDVALELDPRFLEAKLQKAVQLNVLRRHAEVEALLGPVLEENPEHPRVAATYAQLIEMRRGENAAAEQRLRQALARDPYLVVAWRLLGEVLERLGRLPEALESYRSGLERRPDEQQLHARTGLLLARTGGGKEAEMHLREAIRLSPEPQSELRVALGGWLSEQGRVEEAERELEKVLEREPRHPGARNNRAIAFYRTGRAEEAIAELEAIVADFPRHADAHNNLAAIAVERRDWPAAERHARRTLELDPRQAEGWNNLGVALEEQGRPADAETAYRRALQHTETYWQARLNLGLLLSKAQRHAEAAEALQAVVEQVPGFPESHLELGILYSGPLADPERAKTHFNAFLRAAPRHPRTAEVRRRLAELPL